MTECESRQERREFKEEIQIYAKLFALETDVDRIAMGLAILIGTIRSYDSVDRAIELNTEYLASVGSTRRVRR